MRDKLSKYYLISHMHRAHHHQHHGNHLSGGAHSYSTATMESINDRDTPHTQGELSPVSEGGLNAGGNMFELFRTFDGEEFTVYVREDGKKFYVDFEEQKWRYFPDAWNERGSFLPIDYDPYQVRSNEGSCYRSWHRVYLHNVSSGPKY